MKLTCPKSGIRYNVDVGFGSAKALHPIFYIPLPKLLDSSLPPYLAGKFTLVDTHLLGCALLAKLPINRWIAPVASAEQLESTWNSNIKSLATTAARVDDRDFNKLPKYTITRETADLKELRTFLNSVNQSLDESAYSPVNGKYQGDRRVTIQSEVSEALFRIFRDTTGTLRERHKLPGLIASWAAMSGQFPTGTALFKGTKVPVKEFWKSLIAMAFDKDSVAKLLQQDDEILQDYEEIIEHCLQYIPYGTLHMDMLLATLRGAVDVLKEFKPGAVRTISVSVSDIVEHEPETRIIELAAKPAKLEPKRNMFTSNIDYIKARIKWANEVTSYASSIGGIKNEL